MTSHLRWNPYDVDINADPAPVYARLREEAPVYHDEEHGFSPSAGMPTSNGRCGNGRRSSPVAAGSSS